MELSDEDLVHACRRNDQMAWNTLVARYQRLVYSIPRRAGLDEQGAADVFQHVFTTLVEQLDRIEQPAKIASWLATTARREAWRVSRTARASSSFSDSAQGDNEAFQVPDESPLPDVVLQRLEQQHLVHSAVTSLEEPCRGLITALFLRPDPPPYAQIAAALGISEGSIGPTRARCLQKLRRILDANGF